MLPEMFAQLVNPLLEQPTAEAEEVAAHCAGRVKTPEGSAFTQAESITIERADPAALITRNDLFLIIASACPCSTYNTDERLITIRAGNGTWIYRIGRPAGRDKKVFCVRWPD